MMMMMMMTMTMMISISIATGSIDFDDQCPEGDFFFSKGKLNRNIDTVLGRQKSYGVQLVQQTMKKKVNQKTGEIVDVYGTSQRNLLP